MTTQEWEKIAAYLLGAYEAGRAEVSAAKLLVYYEQLQHEEAADVWAAVKQCVRELRFFPSLADLLERLPRTLRQLTPAEAWEYVRSRIGDKEREPEWPDAAIGRALRALGGWRQLNLEPVENLPFRRREFIELYQALSRREKREERLRLEGKAGQAVKELAGALAVEDKRKGE